MSHPSLSHASPHVVASWLPPHVIASLSSPLTAVGIFPHCTSSTDVVATPASRSPPSLRVLVGHQIQMEETHQLSDLDGGGRWLWGRQREAVLGTVEQMREGDSGGRHRHAARATRPPTSHRPPDPGGGSSSVVRSRWRREAAMGTVEGGGPKDSKANTRGRRRREAPPCCSYNSSSRVSSPHRLSHSPNQGRQ